MDFQICSGGGEEKMMISITGNHVLTSTELSYWLTEWLSFI